MRCNGKKHRERSRKDIKSRRKEEDKIKVEYNVDIRRICTFMYKFDLRILILDSS